MQYQRQLHWNYTDTKGWYQLQYGFWNEQYFEMRKGVFREGVYVVKYYNKYRKPITVKVGQGVFRERFEAAFDEYSFQEGTLVRLYVTWAEVKEENAQIRIEKYLGDMLCPSGTYRNVLYIIANPPQY